MEKPEDLRRATELWQEAYRHQMDGELDRAVERYQRSIEAYPTAEAHTFMGWALSVQGRLDEATDECRRAIEIDPQFGNPYNDIGVYLTQQGKPDEAIPWLEKAKQATRYEPRQYPFMNLGRIYLRQGRWWEALRESRGRCGRLRMTAPLAKRCMSSALASTDRSGSPAGVGERVRSSGESRREATLNTSAMQTAPVPWCGRRAHFLKRSSSPSAHARATA